MPLSTIESDVFVDGTFSCTTFLPPAGCITAASVVALAGIEATKLEHQHALTYRQDDGSDVVAAVAPLWIARGVSGTIVGIDVACIDAPSGGDKKFTVDLKKCNAGSSTPATVLSAVVDYVNGTPDCTVLAGTISSAALADGDTLVAEVAVSGSTGAQGQGLIVTVTVREDAQ